MRILWIILSFLLVAVPAGAQEKSDCPNPKKWKPAEAELKRILRAHRAWASKVSSLSGNFEADFAAPGRAVLCNAYLYKAQLARAKLAWVDFRGASLQSANLRGADISQADLRKARFLLADLRNVWLTESDLRGAVLQAADLTNAVALRADLSGARMLKTKLTGADLADARLKNANLRGAIATGADLRGVDLSGADLTGADLAGAKLIGVELKGAKIAGANLAGATFQPTSAPAKGYLYSLEGLASVNFNPGQTSGLVLLRAALREAGLRDLEREATFAIEHGRTRHALASWKDVPGAALEGILRLVFFEWTTGYGLNYGRPIIIILVLSGVFTMIYVVPVSRSSHSSEGAHGIYRVWPGGRIEKPQATPVVRDDTKVEPYVAKGSTILGYAVYFSILSAFHIGWRDVNVGSWIARIQPREYTLRATGWVRTVSGIQSLISVYLVALSVLTYFGRPFE